jgi:peptidoglycan/xylan/chitin deacetylase (PgdA/CDA1 family)
MVRTIKKVAGSKTSKNSSPDLTEFQKIHQRRQNYHIYQKYRETITNVLKASVLLLVAITIFLSMMLIFARDNARLESSPETRILALPPPIAVDNLKDQKLVALTFDDGPDPNTNTLLDILKKEKASATFFVLGMRIDRYGDITRRAYQEGHQIASHTYFHKDLTKLHPGQRQAEIDGTIAAIERTTGAKPTVMRPPYGSWNADVMSAAGMPLILWSIDTEDWKYRDSERIYQHVMANVRDGSIILFHDVYATTVQAVAKIIPALKSQGYAIVTVNRLMMTRGGSFAPGHNYRHLYPN